ncbi:hypothetical protein AX16_003552 [Volvariella volvacea WC 439]|nr:hypothetical protein AX16_003552 [Volvariella volvacea WC 439]
MVTSNRSSTTQMWDSNEGFHGFSGYLDDQTLDTLKVSPDVDYIVEDGYMEAVSSFSSIPITQQEQCSLEPSTNQYTGMANAGTLQLHFRYQFWEWFRYIFLTSFRYIKKWFQSGFGGRARHGPTFGLFTSPD